MLLFSGIATCRKELEIVTPHFVTGTLIEVEAGLMLLVMLVFVMA